MGEGGGGDPSSHKTVKRTIAVCKKGSYTSVTCHFLFRCFDKTQDRLRACSKKSAKLMHNRIVIVEKTRVKTLCLSVLNDDNTVVHQICKCKYLHPCYIL